MAFPCGISMWHFHGVVKVKVKMKVEMKSGNQRVATFSFEQHRRKRLAYTSSSLCDAALR